MIIKKQLHHTRVEFQRMGVVGCVSLVQCLADTELTGDVSQQLQLSGNENMSSLNLAMPDSGSSGNNLPTGEQRLKQARRLIDMTRACSEKKPEVAALFMDEMANAVLIYELHPALQSYLYDLVAESFQVIQNT
jgi:Fanconi anaemia protein FancD2 nuclease